MRRLILILAMLCATLGAFAYTDSFTSMTHDPTFLALLDVVKNGGTEAEAQAAYEAYIATEPSMLDASRANYHMVRYYMDNGDEAKAWEHFTLQEEYFIQMPPTVSDLEKRVAEADLTSSEYYITGSMGTGMDNSKLTKELYKDYPEEYHVAIQEAFRLIYTPHIAGGSSKRAIKLLDEIATDLDGISTPDYYSFLTAQGIGHSKDKKWAESETYFDQAAQIYTFDPAIPEFREKNRKGLD